ncbi:YdcF family protein [Methylobacterium durans]|uniref:YdcF family protein n=1 Tax=Methylobacterium durans TaxID=2202825 RepID=UPI002AFEF8FB|nr:YdcF family protein [Methylobacterium durans]MEA1831205.1 YdcF family protein [Methylobacterium durans]
MPRVPDIRPADAFGWAWQEAGRSAVPLPPAGPIPEKPAAQPGLLGPILLGFGGLGCIALITGFLAFVACLERTERVPPGRADGIVALTGGAERIGEAIDLLAGGYGRRLLITGVNERTSRDQIARLNPSQRYWIECCVDLDYRARNTIGNAIETRRWMQQNRFNTVAVVTSNYHMPRTLIELDHALTGEDRVVPHPVVAEGFDAGRWWSHPPAARLLAAEYVKFLAAWLRTRFETDPEHSHAAVIIGRGKPVKMVAEPVARGLE